MVLGSCGVMDQGSTFGLQGTPIPSQEEINECTPALLHILRSDPKPLPTSPETPHIPMPRHVSAPKFPPLPHTLPSPVKHSAPVGCGPHPLILPKSSHVLIRVPQYPQYHPLHFLRPTSVPYTFSSSSFLTCRSHPCHSTVRLYGIWRQVGGRRGQRWALGVLAW